MGEMEVDDAWGSLAGQPCRISALQFTERPCFKTQGGQHLRLTSDFHTHGHVS